MRPSDAKLAAALHEAGLTQMAQRAERGYYNEFFGELALPMSELVEELIMTGSQAGLALRVRVMRGEFDATDEEAEEWARGSQARDIARELRGKR